MGRKDCLPSFRQFSLIVGVNSEQRFPFFDLIPYFVMDDEANRMIDGIGFTSAPGSQCHGSFSHAPRLDLSQIAVLRRFYQLDEFGTREFGWVIYICDNTTMRLDKHTEFFKGRPLRNGFFY